MSTTTNLVAIIGSLRRGSVNRITFDAARELLPGDVTLTEVPVAEVPFFNQDLEGDDEPAAVVTLKTTVAASDGLIFFTPEYNGSVPAVTKNAFDWLTRPVGAGPIAGLPVGIVATTPGGRAGQGVREHLGRSASFLTDRYFPETLGIGSVYDAITDDELTGSEARGEIADWLTRLVEHVRTVPAEAPR
jgi:NAD(P)H-dependent FMN reductase